MKKSIKRMAIVLFTLISIAALADEKTTTSISVTKSTNGNQNSVTQSTTTSTTTTEVSQTDDKIVSGIYAKYAKDPALIGTSINVTSTNGVVTLNGTVTAQSQEDEAVIAAKSVPNVKDVRSSINVTTNPKTTKPIQRLPNY